MSDTRPFFRKFRVVRIETGEEVLEPTFTLIPSRDPWAAPALLAYADACAKDAPDLAHDLRRLAEGPKHDCGRCSA